MCLATRSSGVGWVLKSDTASSCAERTYAFKFPAKAIECCMSR